MKPATKELLIRVLQTEIDILKNQMCRLTPTDISLFQEKLNQYEEALEDLKGVK